MTLLEAIEKGEFVSVKNLDQAKLDAIDAAKTRCQKQKISIFDYQRKIFKKQKQLNLEFLIKHFLVQLFTGL